MTRVVSKPKAQADTQIDVAKLYHQMALIRAFEEKLLERFQAKQLTGTTHTYIGQEATAVAALSYLQPGDFVTSQHRSHGYFIAAGGDPRRLFLEIIGDATGVCNGVGGSQHLYTPNFLSNGILGGTAGVAAGIAMAAKLRQSGHIVVCFLGDGTMGEGLTYESLNFAALWKLPILFVIENNRYAQTTPVALQLAGTIAGRAEAFGIAADEIESNDVVDLAARFDLAFAHVRSGRGPYCQVVNTYRVGPHSKGDDFRPEAERRLWRGRDPLRLAEQRLGGQAEAIRRDAESKAAAATEMPEQVAMLPPDQVGDDSRLVPDDHQRVDGWRSEGAGKWMLTHLQQVFPTLLKRHPEIYLLGEDILDPYGGAFKVYKGLSDAFPERVLTTPISEAGMTGIANGMALRGYRPIVEIMFGDFSTLIIDQLLNHATKFARMFRNGVSCPVIVRTPFGGYRGYGPTHSQSLEKLFFGVPGLVVTASDMIHDPELIWERMLGLSAPCLHVENKVLYSAELPDITDGRLGPFRLTSSRGYFPTTTLSLRGGRGTPDIAVVAYGGLVGMALEAAQTLFVEHEILADVVVPSQLAPLPVQDLVDASAAAGAVLVLEEGTERFGFGAEVIAQMACRGALSDKRVARCAAIETIIPNNATLEKLVLPGVERVVRLSANLAR